MTVTDKGPDGTVAHLSACSSHWVLPATVVFHSGISFKGGLGCYRCGGTPRRMDDGVEAEGIQALYGNGCVQWSAALPWHKCRNICLQALTPEVQAAAEKGFLPPLHVNVWDTEPGGDHTEIPWNSWTRLSTENACVYWDNASEKDLQTNNPFFLQRWCIWKGCSKNWLLADARGLE